MHRIAKLSLALTLACSFCTAAAFADTVTLGDLTRGTYNQNGTSITGGSGTANGNYITGTDSGNTFHSFFTFNLGSLTGTVTGAQFQVSTANSGSGSSPVTFDLDAYSGDIASLNAGTAGTSGYNNLANGLTFLGSASVPTSGAPSTLTINLNSAALAFLQADEGSQFAIGGYLPTPANSENFLFGISSNAPATNLVITTTPAAPTVPEPSTLILLGTGLLGVAETARRRLARP